MNFSDETIRNRLRRFSEDSKWEFKQFDFNGNAPVSPKRDDIADELCAFANASGGVLLCGVSDDGQIQGMSKERMKAVGQLLVELSTDAIRPPLHINIEHRELDNKVFILVEVPQGDAVHERDGRSFIRVGPTKRRLEVDERLRLAQKRAQNRYLWFDKQIVAEAGFETFEERLWEPLLSVTGATDPRQGLINLRLLAKDEAGVVRATVAGVLLCTKWPQEWLAQATIIATLYRGKDRASGQLDSQEIVGPLPEQIADTVKFIKRNMRIAARKLPEREDMPQYSITAIFEAVVNAVTHRDYSISSRRIRISMFEDRLEIDSPGSLPNGITVESMGESQATRNEVIASIFGRINVGDMPGSSHRRYLMERRGDGVSIIQRETEETAGIQPVYKTNETNVMLNIPSAKLELTPSNATVIVRTKGVPIAGVEVLVIFPNKTWQLSSTDKFGVAGFDLYTTHLQMTVYVAAPGYAAGIERNWSPNKGDLLLELCPVETGGGSAIFTRDSGHLPGLRGQLNPIRDHLDRTYLYADNISINEGRQQPVSFRLGKSMLLTDSHGYELSITIIDIVGRSSLVEYRQIGR